ncbi:MAG: hypothetical protein GY950_12185 [bacterium]|nr:hypothetical protein [bacterium]
MTRKTKRELLKKELQEDLDNLDLSVKALTYSYKKCEKTGIKDEFSEDELESFEALTSRFARTSDLFTQKILTTLFILLKENPISFIDKANKSEKMGIISNSEELQEVRELRNEIAHEYSSRDVTEIFEEVLRYTPLLMGSIKSTKSYIKKNIPMDSES